MGASINLGCSRTLIRFPRLEVWTSPAKLSFFGGKVESYWFGGLGKWAREVTGSMAPRKCWAGTSDSTARFSGLVMSRSVMHGAELGQLGGRWSSYGRIFPLYG
jgi:hypothetical protein